MENISEEKIEEFLCGLQNPARYTGGELNQVVKTGTLLRMAISYPDLYEIGMSNEGIKILYDIANRMEDVSCERVFAVPPDFEEKLRKMKMPLYTLETFTPINQMDLLGFNISHELLYANVLQILDLGGVPLLAKDRSEGHPIVIAGGGAVSNPMPASDFIDAFFIGDGEDGIKDILEVLIMARKDLLGRSETLIELGKVEGLFVPSLYSFLYGDEKYTGFRGNIVNKRIYRGDGPVAPAKPLIPNIRITHERVVVEVTRGCRNLCKFCHAGYYELPCRSYSPPAVKDTVLNLFKNTGYNELSLASLSLSDYSGLSELLNMLLPDLISRGLSISLPSLRVDKNTLSIIEHISDIRKSTLTFAVESACDEIRRISNKRLLREDLLEIVQHVFSSGWRSLKLYFMLGLPGSESSDEANEIVMLLKDIYRIAKSIVRKAEINVTLSPFVPKPHTPFQREEQRMPDYFESAVRKIKSSLPGSIVIKNHDIRASLLEGLFSRGDGRMGRFILASYLQGARLDSWKEYFRFDIWEKNLGLLPDWDSYLGARGKDDPLPWEFIRTGYEKIINLKSRKQGELKKLNRPLMVPLDTISMKRAFSRFELKYQRIQRIRIKFSKTGFSRYIPHIDFMEIIKRSLRRCNTPVSFTQGFNKKERISMGFPLPLGYESLSEYCDIDLYDEVDSDRLADEMNKNLPRGISVKGIVIIGKKDSLMGIIKAVEYFIGIKEKSILDSIFTSLRFKPNFYKRTKRGEREIKFNDAVLDYSYFNNDSEEYMRCAQLNGGLKGYPCAMTARISVGNENSMRMDEILISLAGVSNEDLFKFDIIKTAQLQDEEGRLVEI